MKNAFFLVVGLVIIIGSIYLALAERLLPEKSIRILKIGQASIEVEVVDTIESRATGLSGRESLEQGKGMLFIFETPATYGFWMKDMLLAIDIVWIDEEMKVVGVEKNVLPETYPEVFYPNEPIKYVLELPSGNSEFFSIDIGEILYLE